jgi:hypothetical protein
MGERSSLAEYRGQRTAERLWEHGEFTRRSYPAQDEEWSVTVSIDDMRGAGGPPLPLVPGRRRIRPLRPVVGCQNQRLSGPAHPQTSSTGPSRRGCIDKDRGVILNSPKFHGLRDKLEKMETLPMTAALPQRHRLRLPLSSVFYSSRRWPRRRQARQFDGSVPDWVWGAGLDVIVSRPHPATPRVQIDRVARAWL